MLSNPYNKYKTNAVNTATKEELTLMLYDGCLRFMTLSSLAIEEGNIEKAHTNLVKAQAIVRELDITLDDKFEISKEMHRLYDFVIDKLIEANLRKTKQPIEDAKPIIQDFRDAWKEAMIIARKG